MLIHEWMKHRDKRFARRESEEEVLGAAEAAVTEPEPAQAAAPGATADAAEVSSPAVVSEPALEELSEEVSAALALPPASPAPPPRAAAPPMFAEVPEAQSRRLQALLGRQGRLPLEVEAPPAPRRGHPAPAESREELIERLLDPILSINEAATLCGVCPASIRRYTNRGVLKCFRTPGNQRRFRLSDVLDFMERQQEEALD